jgi:hypothetical protein
LQKKLVQNRKAFLNAFLADYLLYLELANEVCSICNAPGQLSSRDFKFAGPVWR